MNIANNNLTYEEYLDARTITRKPQTSDEERIQKFYAVHMDVFDEFVKHYMLTTDVDRISSERLNELWRFYITGRLIKDFFSTVNYQDYQRWVSECPLVKKVRSVEHYTTEMVLDAPLKLQCDSVLLFLVEKLDSCERLRATLHTDNPATWLNKNGGRLQLFANSDTRNELEMHIAQVMRNHPLTQV
jgi:hypothetical protein